MTGSGNMFSAHAAQHLQQEQIHGRHGATAPPARAQRPTKEEVALGDDRWARALPRATLPAAPMPQQPPPNMFQDTHGPVPRSQKAEYAQPVHRNPGYMPAWDPYGNYAGYTSNEQRPRTPWRINRQHSDGLFKFDGELQHYKAWKSRARDHASEDLPHWRQVLDHAEKCQTELKIEDLPDLTLFGVKAFQLTSDLWSFLLRWIGPTLYLGRTKLSPQIEGNGLELWRRMFSEYEGSDELIRMACRMKFLKFPAIKDLKVLNAQLD